MRPTGPWAALAARGASGKIAGWAGIGFGWEIFIAGKVLCGFSSRDCQIALGLNRRKQAYGLLLLLEQGLLNACAGVIAGFNHENGSTRRRDGVVACLNGVFE